MKSLIIGVGAIICALISTTALAKEHKIGVGFVLGEPTALSGKYLVSAQHAIDLQLAFNSSDYLLVYGDYHWRFPGVFNSDDEIVQQLTPYVGAGPLLAFASKKDHGKGGYFDKRDDKFAAGVRIPFGIEWIGAKVPIGIGAEIAPGIVIAPATTGFLQGGITLRYYF